MIYCKLESKKDFEGNLLTKSIQVVLETLRPDWNHSLTEVLSSPWSCAESG